MTGVALGLTSKWGVLRYPWVTAKLGLVVSVMAVGAVVIGPGLQAERDGILVVAAAYWVLALCLATGLSVFKPGAARRRPARGGRTRPASPPPSPS